MKCGIDQCDKVYAHYRSLKRHRMDTHLEYGRPAFKPQGPYVFSEPVSQPIKKENQDVDQALLKTYNNQKTIQKVFWKY